VIAAGVLFAALNEVFYQIDALAGYLDIVSAGLLIVVLLVYPGGIAAIPGTLRGVWRRFEPTAQRLAERITLPRPVLKPAPALAVDGDATEPVVTLLRPSPRQRLANLLTVVSDAPPPVEEASTEVPTSTSLTRLADMIAAAPSAHELPEQREHRAVLLEAEEVSMRFGGLLAVDGVSMSVREGEIVGLIGPNGAGKTTTFNCISGLLVPTSGRVTLFGRDVTSLPVHERARMGLGRTFQVIQLFPQLTVFDNLLVATHGSNHTNVLDHIAVTKRAILAERDARRWVAQVVQLLDLEEVADRPVAGLPFGVLRMVEVARAVVTGARLVMLDEPASGLDNAETQRLADLLLTLRVGLGLTLLLIEHDVKMVTSVSDYMYVLDRGRLLAEGTARAVQTDRAVIAAYLGEPVTGVVA
jgi:branched-chain amino acid transport system ATP-binding protein